MPIYDADGDIYAPQGVILGISHTKGIKLKNAASTVQIFNTVGGCEFSSDGVKKFFITERGGLAVVATNNTGVSLNSGSVVVWDSANNYSVTSSTTVNDSRVAGAVWAGTSASDPVLNGSDFYLVVSGYAKINTDGVPVKGDIVGYKGSYVAGVTNPTGSAAIGIVVEELLSNTVVVALRR